MEAVSYTNGSDIYTVKPIVGYGTVDADADNALNLVDYDIESIDDYKNAMKDSVDQGLAYDAWKNDERIGYVYNRIVGHLYVGCSIYSTSLISMILLFKTMFEMHDANKIVFQPHGNNISKFRSLILGTSYRLYNNGANTVTILKKDVETKGRAIFKYLGLK